MKLLGLDIGSSSVKASVIDIKSGQTLGTTFYPEDEMPIIAKKSGWAEQEPEQWWVNINNCLKNLKEKKNINIKDIEAIGISYQMHGLVCIDKDREVLRPSIIWCDSRAVETGNKAFKEIGNEKCLSHLLNSPGNFTASKLKWVKENESEIYSKIYKIMLPGDYIAMKLTGEINTTISGLSEGIFWDFKENHRADFLFDYYGLDYSFIPEIVSTFSIQGQVTKEAANELGLKEGIPVSYRAGDQPNNAFSLNVLNVGEIAATAGTSGVIYGVTDAVNYDPVSRVNIFAHVNHSEKEKRLGVLLCLNGTGILNNWLRKIIGNGKLSYQEMDNLAMTVPIGSDGISIFPFGNGAERMLENNDLGAYLTGINFNRHDQKHLCRAVQEGIAFALNYGIQIMKDKNKLTPSIIKAGHANMFISDVFAETIAGITNTPIYLYNTDGSVGAARGAGVGAKFYKTTDDAFKNLKIVKQIEPKQNELHKYEDAYQNWYTKLIKIIN